MSFIDGVRLSEQERQAEQDRALRAQQIAQQNQISQQNYLMAQERAKRDRAEWDQKQADRNFLMGGNLTPDSLRQRGMFHEANYMETAAQKKAEEAEKLRKDRDSAAVNWITNTAHMTPEQRADLYQKSLPQLVQRFGQGNLPEAYSEDWYQSIKSAFVKPKEDKGIKPVDYLDNKGNLVTIDANTGKEIANTPRALRGTPEKTSGEDKVLARQKQIEQDKIAANDKAIEESRRYMAGKVITPGGIDDPVLKANYLKANETKSTGDWEKTRYLEARPYVNKVGSDQDVVSAAKSLAARGYSKQQIKEILKAAGAKD